MPTGENDTAGSGGRRRHCKRAARRTAHAIGRRQVEGVRPVGPTPSSRSPLEVCAEGACAGAGEPAVWAAFGEDRSAEAAIPGKRPCVQEHDALAGDRDGGVQSIRPELSHRAVGVVCGPKRRWRRASQRSTRFGVGECHCDAPAIDLEEFKANARAGLEHMRRNESALALERLTAAEAAYAGDLFEEDVYADWAVMPREAARALYNRVGRALADLSTSAGDPDGAAAYLRRVVARDAYDEPSHLALITALARGRSHGEARRAYQAYVARMAEIEVEPAPYPASAVS
jgi:hypothetical protein